MTHKLWETAAFATGVREGCGLDESKFSEIVDGSSHRVAMEDLASAAISAELLEDTTLLCGAPGNDVQCVSVLRSVHKAADVEEASVPDTNESVKTLGKTSREDERNLFLGPLQAA